MMFVSCVYGLLRIVCFFFFKQKTAYEMRISDWSSDVCSSDLPFFDRVAISEHLFEIGVFTGKRPRHLVKAAVVLELVQVVAAPRAPPHHLMAMDPRVEGLEHRRVAFSSVHIPLQIGRAHV